MVVRVDGRGFSRFTAPRFNKPLDPAFHKLMVQTAQVLLEALQGCYAYTESDEISVLCPPEWELFDRKLEKVVSLSAGTASGAFTHACGVPVQFDSRVWLGAQESQVVVLLDVAQLPLGRGPKSLNMIAHAGNQDDKRSP